MRRPFLTVLVSVLLAVAFLTAPAQPPKAAADSVPAIVKKTGPARPVPTNLPDMYTGRQIRVGSGGGFTGFVMTYYLLDNGQLYSRQSPDTTYHFLGNQSTASTKRLFAAVETKCRIKNTRFNKPGNMYKFVQWKKGKRDYRVTWGATDATAPAVYARFYHSFMNMVPTSTRL